MGKKKGIADLIRSYIDKEGIPSSQAELARRIVSENRSLFSQKDDSKAVHHCKNQIFRTVKQLSRNNTFGDELQKNRFDRGNWSHGWLKTDGASIFIKNPELKIQLDELIDSVIERMKDHSPSYPTFKKPERKSRLLAIDPADVHIGKLSVSEETGHSYNREIAAQRFKEGINGVISEVQDKGSIGQILFIIGNDILHVDTPKGSTTKGTLLDKDGQWWEMIDLAQELYVSAIEMMMEIAPVHVVHCPSNHDFVNGYTLAKMVQAHFRKTKRVSFDISIKQRKYIVYGVNLIGASHGDGAPHAELPNIMTVEAREHISSTLFRYWLIHHGHHKDRKKYRGKAVSSEKDLNSVTIIETDYTPPIEVTQVEMVRSPSPPDAWHNRKGYMNIQALEAYVFCAFTGQKARFTHNF